MLPHQKPLLFAIAATLAVATACTGPALHIDNPGQHTVFVDGRATTATSLPFRYYGTTRWDAVPADVGGRSDWRHQPKSQLVLMPVPVSAWIFPLDFPLELLARAANGRGDVTTQIAVDPAPGDRRTEDESANAEVAALAERAKAARIAR